MKQYASEKAVTEDGWSHEKITLKPRNPDFAAMEFLEDADGGLDVVAEFVEVLGG